MKNPCAEPSQTPVRNKFTEWTRKDALVNFTVRAPLSFFGRTTDAYVGVRIFGLQVQTGTLPTT